MRPPCHGSRLGERRAVIPRRDFAARHHKINETSPDKAQLIRRVI
jgi:hypothetical protein